MLPSSGLGILMGFNAAGKLRAQTAPGASQMACPALDIQTWTGDGKKQKGEQMSDASTIHAVGMAQRLLLWAVLASILGFIIPFAFLVTIPFQLYCVYKLAKALQFSTVASILYLLAMFIPLVSLICLLVLNGKATGVLRAAGIKVGLMGAKLSDLPEAVDE